MQWLGTWLPAWFAAWFGGAGSSAPGLVQAPAQLAGSAQLTGAEQDSGGSFPLAVRRWWRAFWPSPPPPIYAPRARLTASPQRLTGTATLTPPDESLELLLILAAG